MQPKIMRDSRTWHLEKSVSVGHIVTTIVVAGSMLMWAMTVEKRVSIIESATVIQTKIDDRQDQSNREAFMFLREDLRGIADKIDRLNEASHK